MQIPSPLNNTAQSIYKHYERVSEDGLRPHLGASLIGHHCPRFLWYTFRWGAIEQLEGRVLRLFETGQLEENRIVANLKAIGCEVHQTDENGVQFNFSTLNGHFGGSMDACVKGIPEAPNTWHVVEMKTHSEKSFAELKKNGVQESKPLHYAQMQVYMGLSSMQRALYFAVNKNTDEIYTERFRYDSNFFKELIKKAEQAINAPTPPVGISQNPSWYECKMCKYYNLCHQTQVPPPTCRSCAHSSPIADGKWQCERNHHEISTTQQKTGCSDHRYIPILLERFAIQRDGSNEDNWVEYQHTTTGNHFINGEKGFSSQEIYACQDKKALGASSVNQLKDTFNAKAIG